MTDAHIAYPFVLDLPRFKTMDAVTSRAKSLVRALIERLPFFRDNTQLISTAAHMVRPIDIEATAHPSAATLREFQRMIVPHLDAAYNFARFLSRDADAAGDIVQEAFLRACRGFENYRGGDPRAWMFSIIRNCYRAWLADGRRRSRFEVPIATGSSVDDAEPLAYQIASEADTPETTTIQKNQSERVRAVISSLSEPMREILVLRELEDLSYRQISEIIDAPIGTVMSRLARARTEFGEAWRMLENSEAGR